MQIFIGGIGCFWDETEYHGISGVVATECGYCGGKSSKISYEQVCGGNTFSSPPHVPRAVKISFSTLVYRTFI